MFRFLPTVTVKKMIYRSQTVALKTYLQSCRASSKLGCLDPPELRLSCLNPIRHPFCYPDKRIALCDPQSKKMNALERGTEVYEQPMLGQASAAYPTTSYTGVPSGVSQMPTTYHPYMGGPYDFQQPARIAKSTGMRASNLSEGLSRAVAPLEGDRYMFIQPHVSNSRPVITSSYPSLFPSLSVPTTQMLSKGLSNQQSYLAPGGSVNPSNLTLRSRPASRSHVRSPAVNVPTVSAIPNFEDPIRTRAHTDGEAYSALCEDAAVSCVSRPLTTSRRAKSSSTSRNLPIAATSSRSAMYDVSKTLEGTTDHSASTVPTSMKPMHGQQLETIVEVPSEELYAMPASVDDHASSSIPHAVDEVDTEDVVYEPEERECYATAPSHVNDASAQQDFGQVSLIFERIAGRLGIPFEEVVARFDVFRLDKRAEHDAFQLYKAYYNMHTEEESKRVPLATDGDISHDAEHVYKCWQAFKNANPSQWPSILVFKSRIPDERLSNDAASERRRVLEYFMRQLRSTLDALAESYGFHSVLIVSGNDIVRDDGIGMAYESSESEGFLCKLTRSSTDEVIGHLKAHVWNNHSTARLAQAMTPEKAPVRSTHNDGRSNDDAPIEPEEAAQPLKTNPDDLSGMSDNSLLTQLRKVYEAMLEVQHGIPCQPLPWVKLPCKLATNGLVFENWPENVQYPGQVESGNKGIGVLSGDERQRFLRALTQLPQEQRVRLRACDRQELRDEHVVLIISGVPSSQFSASGLRVFYNLRNSRIIVDQLNDEQGDRFKKVERVDVEVAVHSSTSQKCKVDLPDAPNKRVRYTAYTEDGNCVERFPSDVSDGEEEPLGNSQSELEVSRPGHQFSTAKKADLPSAHSASEKVEVLSDRPAQSLVTSGSTRHAGPARSESAQSVHGASESHRAPPGMDRQSSGSRGMVAVTQLRDTSAASPAVESPHSSSQRLALSDVPASPHASAATSAAARVPQEFLEVMATQYLKFQQQKINSLTARDAAPHHESSIANALGEGFDVGHGDFTLNLSQGYAGTDDEMSLYINDDLLMGNSGVNE
ncbi:uncharacterized protein LAESUDRAFT_712986 [Laetiporus sulphureus 93-53]|uniref:Uncharacterized protein n=1 Tax=Laetiporus sulphureus 93-53 TaxID=1314785 RepID=A0A165F6J9_9APHY|nr:uncharacterized protein LAESUDRAFT_712986 [Laetiporus sulphureus 93-53]KZT08491.1 hypothetical protein LAESUDRAFT_712986 [Laetiporus sulphureus 93-53]